MALRTVSICTGATAGLELGIRIAVGNVIPLCYVEREKTACETLAARFEDGSLDPAPIWSDLASFDGRRLRGLVDLCAAGLPCQPYSVAGKRVGHSDERAIWPEFLRVVREMLPTLVFLENVPEFLKYFRPIGEELYQLGYRVEEPLLIAASDVGASHKRLRVFILAHRGFGSSGRREPFPITGRGGTSDHRHDREELAEPEIGRWGKLREPSGSDGFSDWNNEVVADAGRGLLPFEGRGPEERTGLRSTGEDVADPGYVECERDSRRGREAGYRIYSLDLAPGPFAFSPDNPAWSEIVERAPYLAPAIESGFRCLVNGTALLVDQSRTDQLRALGNGVVPLQAACAFRLLTREAGIKIND